MIGYLYAKNVIVDMIMRDLEKERSFMARVLCTGGAGFIGSHLVDKLIDEGHLVWTIDDYSGGTLSNINHKPIYPGGFIACKADCRDATTIDYLMNQFKPEVVYHLACNAAEQKAQFSPIDITSRNYDAFIKVLTPFIKYGGQRFIFTSSIAVYGGLQTPFSETDKPEPEDLYGITKLAAEQTLKVMSKIHGFEYVIARPHNVYGPRQNMRDPYRNVVTIWMNQILRGEPVTIYGDGEQRRCFSYIDDVVDALFECMGRDVNGMTFNIGADKDHTLNELYSAMASNVPVRYLPARDEVKIAIADHTQAKGYLDYKDKTPLAQGLEATWDWCKTMGPQDPIYTGIEIPSKALPINWIK